jgi:DNA-binding beta-propeller fold protein YncE
MAYVISKGGLVPIDLTIKKSGAPMAIPTGFEVTALALTPDGKTAYATMHKIGANTGMVVPIDLATSTIGAALPTPYSSPDKSIPLAVAIAPDGRFGYVTSAVGAADGSISTKSDAAAMLTGIDLTHAYLQPLMTMMGSTFPLGVAVSPDSKTVYMTVINTDIHVGSSAGGVETIDTAKDALVGGGVSSPIDTYPRAIVITPDGKTAYVVVDGTGAGGEVVPIDLANPTNTSQTFITTPDGVAPTNIAITRNGKTAYVISSGSSGGNVLPINLATKTSGNPIPINGNPVGIAISPDGKTAYVTARKTSSSGVALVGAIDAVWPIDLTTNTLMAPLVVGDNPTQIVIAP